MEWNIIAIYIKCYPIYPVSKQYIMTAIYKTKHSLQFGVAQSSIQVRSGNAGPITNREFPLLSSVEKKPIVVQI